MVAQHTPTHVSSFADAAVLLQEEEEEPESGTMIKDPDRSGTMVANKDSGASTTSGFLLGSQATRGR